MDITFNGSHQYFSGAPVFWSFTFEFNIGCQFCNCFFHYTGTLYYLWKEHLSCTEKIPNFIHPIHQGTFNNTDWFWIMAPCFLNIKLNEFIETPYKRMFYSFWQRKISPFIYFFFLFAALFQILSKFHKSFCWIFTAIKDDIFCKLKKIRGYFTVNLQHASIYNPHILSGFNWIIKEDRMHCFPDRICSPEWKWEIAYSAAYLGIRKVFLYPFCCMNKVYSIVIMFLNTGCYGEYIGIENYIFRRKSGFLNKNFIW